MKQKGQGIVEFALVVPILAALGIGIVYVGIMFLDYTQYSNAARDAARDISLQAKFITDENLDPSSRSRNAAAMRQEIADALNDSNKANVENYATKIKRYQHPFTNIYEPTWNVQFYKWDDKDKKLVPASPNKALDAKAVEVKIGIKFKDGVDSNGEWAGFSFENWFRNFATLPPITYRMILEE